MCGFEMCDCLEVDQTQLATMSWLQRVEGLHPDKTWLMIMDFLYAWSCKALLHEILSVIW